MNINILKNFYDIPDNANEYVLYSKKINVIKNGHFAYSTFIKSKRPITKKQVREFIKKKEKPYMKFDNIYLIDDGNFVYGSTGNIDDYESNESWNVELITDIYKKHDYDEENYVDYQLGGYQKHFIRIDPHEKYLNQDPEETNIRDTLYRRKLVNFDKSKNTHYMILKIYKDGNFIEDFKIEHTEPITEKHILKAVNFLQENKDYYGSIYNLSLTWENAILETTGNDKYLVYYDDKLKMQ
jgi:hypothetical protein